MHQPSTQTQLILTGRISLVAALAACSLAVQAQTLHAANIVDLSLEQLANIEVVSISKRPQRLADVAATAYVISAEDIRRSGATSVPEALRLAPNLQVARADTNQYAVTARGFNSVLANKLLVLIDGRTVYSPLFSGVFWEAQDVMLEDVERIEVLSGPGGTLYGSNAVQGVINIITRGSADTQGLLAAAGGGNTEQLAAGRYGGTTAGGTSYRFWARHVRRDNSEITNGTAVRDESRMSHGGFRADHRDARDLFTLQGDIYETKIDQAPSARRVSGFNLLGRWSRELEGGGRSQLQAYFDRSERDQPSSLRDTLDTWDIEYQQLSRPAASHELIWGGGWRMYRDSVTNTSPAVLALLPPERRLDLWNVFAQDEVALRPDVKLTLGLKLEHNDYTGLEALPNARLAWEMARGHLMWFAASRTVRTPARLDVEFYQPGAAPFFIAGGPNFVSEVARVYELGYRGQPAPSISYSASVFHHDYERLRSLDLAPGGGTFNNNFEGRMNGFTAWGNWRVADPVRLSAGYAYQDQRFQALPGTAPLGGVASLGNDPKHRWLLGAAIDLPANMELDLHVRHMGPLPSPAVPSYTALDARWGWRVRPDLELSVAVRNVGDPRHPEWGAPANRAEHGRSVFFKAVWRQ